MSVCRNQAMAYGAAWPKSCPTCGLAGNCTQLTQAGVDALKKVRPEYASILIPAVAQPANTDSASGSPGSESTRPDQPKLPESGGIGGSSIGLGAEGEQ